MLPLCSVNSLNAPNYDRVVTIRGELKGIMLAADKVYTKLKTCYEADMQTLRFNVSQPISQSVMGKYLFIIDLLHCRLQVLTQKSDWSDLSIGPSVTLPHYHCCLILSFF